MLGGSVSMLLEVYKHSQLIFWISITAHLPRINNAVDGCHRGFLAHVSACHSVFWKFLEVLQKEEAFVRVGILQNQGGHQPPLQRRRYVDCNHYILGFVDDFPNYQGIDYLRGIAHILAD